MTKHCNRCDTTKPIENFTVNRSKGCVDNRHYCCRDCKRALERPHQMLKRYGITLDEVLAMSEAQSDRCAICRREPGGRDLSVDHCHATGKVRGLLCYRCNQYLGYIHDDTSRLARAIEYLQGVET